MRNGTISQVNLLNYSITDEYGATHYYLNGKLHRVGGPAIDWPGVQQVWAINGICHRTDGPAIIWNSGREEFWVNGIRIDRHMHGGRLILTGRREIEEIMERVNR